MSRHLAAPWNAESVLNELNRDFPFAVELSLAPLIKFWNETIAAEDSLRGRLARELCREVEGVPELSRPIRDLALLETHRGLVDALMAAVFPTVFWEKEYAAALTPFELKSFHATPAFELDLMGGSDGHLHGRLNVDKQSLGRFRLLNAFALALQRLYGIDFSVDYPIIFTVPERTTGLDRHLRISFEGRFIDVEPTGALPPLDADVRARLEAGAADFDMLAALFPAGSVRFRGFTVLRAIDVTDQEVLSSLKRDLIDKESIVSNARFQALQAKLRTLFRRPELRLGLAAFAGERVLALNYGAKLEHSCIFADSVHHKLSDFAGSVYQRAGLERRPLFIQDLAAYPEPTPIEEAMLRGGVRSIVIAPLHYQDATIGTLSLSSPRPGDLTTLQTGRLSEVLPLFSMAVKRSLDEFDNRVQAFIKETCTAIHPVVEWRFRKAVFDGLERKGAEATAAPTEMEPIVFRDVYPLYAIADIRGSSVQRSWAIQSDLLRQLGLARDVLRAAHDARPLPILDQLTHRVDTSMAEIEVSLRSGDEVAIIAFLRGEIESLFEHLQSFGPSTRERIEAYRRALDPRIGTVYAKRQDFEESVTLIAETISSYVDLEEQAAQGMYPHYFEKQKTDGVDYSIYLGGSLLEDGRFDPLYLKNMRLWQLMVSCGIALRAERLKDRLSVPLEVTSLILVQHTPLSIRFRPDEKRFDVDGAYNVRYEIIKKRIDKAVISGTTERLTQPGKVAIVYSHPSEAAEWREYVEYLQKLGYLTRDVEDFELEELQGAQGLRALRVAVDLTTREANGPSTIAHLPAAVQNNSAR
jgi:hypothetical protein